MTSEADVLVVGGGIAGLSAAYFAARAGHRVTVVDEGVHRASDLPIALVNPLRGRTGRLVADGVDGMHASFALVDALRAAGHAIDAERGLYRPLVGAEGEWAERAFWAERIGGRLAFDWHEAAPQSLGLATGVPALRLHDAGWIAPKGLLDALRSESDATLVVDRVTSVVPDAEGAGGVATLAGGATIAARALLWCGGAWGAALLDREAPAPAGALYKPGSLVAVDASLTSAPMSFGLYAAPWTGSLEGVRRPGTLVGPTREGSCPAFPDDVVAIDALAHLGDRIGRVFGTTMPVREVWRGVRLARMSSTAAATLAGVPTLTALGSRGFLMAPLLAAAWARSL